ncbi:ATP-binding protein [Hyphomicrobiales bacterium 4NK60-0047b]|jgi:predicted kinase
MSNDLPTLHLICGKIAAGKSRLASKLADEPSTLLISEDAWLSQLYPEEISNIDDYIRCSKRLRQVMGSHVGQILSSGVSVVLDFPANTVSIREWMKGISDAAGVRHELHFIDVPDELCKARLKKRNESGNHEFSASEDDFDLITSYFMPPTPSESLNITLHTAISKSGLL